MNQAAHVAPVPIRCPTIGVRLSRQTLALKKRRADIFQSKREPGLCWASCRRISWVHEFPDFFPLSVICYVVPGSDAFRRYRQ
jgi:hypothetical protein